MSGEMLSFYIFIAKPAWQRGVCSRATSIDAHVRRSVFVHAIVFAVAAQRAILPLCLLSSGDDTKSAMV